MRRRIPRGMPMLPRNVRIRAVFLELECMEDGIAPFKFCALVDLLVKKTYDGLRIKGRSTFPYLENPGGTGACQWLRGSYRIQSSFRGKLLERGLPMFHFF